MTIKTNMLSDERALNLLDSEVISINRKKGFYTTNQGEIISLKSSKSHEDGMTYWYGITPQNVNDYKNSGITHACFIIGYEGVVKIPIDLIYKYLKNTYTSTNKTNGAIKHYHLYLKYQEVELYLYSNANHKFNVDNYVILEEDMMIEEINKKSIDTLIKEARRFVDFKNQYNTKDGATKHRNESSKQKERIAAIEGHTCQVCDFYQEYYKKGKRRWIIHIDHIVEKSAGGGEKIDNLWALCPNCHSMKTCGVIQIQKDKKGKYYVSKNNVKIEFRDKHLNK